MSDFYARVRSQQVLAKAWQRVRANGLSSSSEDTRRQIKEFDQDSLRQLNIIQRQLREDRFKFDAQKGVPILKKKGSEKRRPLVLASIRNRVVQRAILDVLQERVPAVQDGASRPCGR